MKRIAVFADVHGNLTAFKAIHHDILQQNVDECWSLGDIFMPGPGTKDLWELFEDLDPQVCVRGNWDDLLLRGFQGELSIDRESHVYMARLAQFIAPRLPKRALATIANWPLTRDVAIESLRFGLSHNLPWKNFDQTLYPTADQKGFDSLFKERMIDVAIYAHVHHPIMRYGMGEQLVLNPGSVGEPFNSWRALKRDLRAQYLLIEVDEMGLHDISFRKIGYDRQAELHQAQLIDLPYLDLYQDLMDNGVVHTHDHDLLRKINHERGYLDDVCKYQAQLKK